MPIKSLESPPKRVTPADAITEGQGARREVRRARRAEKVASEKTPEEEREIKEEK
jgi:hypothetical protein